jgi:hypothetical protein
VHIWLTYAVCVCVRARAILIDACCAVSPPGTRCVLPYLLGFSLNAGSLSGCDSRERRHPVAVVYKAVFGVNKFLVTYPPELKRQFPEHVTRTTVYGRMTSKNSIVNVDFALEHDDQVGSPIHPRPLCRQSTLGAIGTPCRHHTPPVCVTARPPTLVSRFAAERLRRHL